MFEKIFILNFILCLFFKVASDIYFFRNTKDRSLHKVLAIVGYWQYSIAERLLEPRDVGRFRFLYKTAQVFLLLLILEATVGLVVAAGFSTN